MKTSNLINEAQYDKLYESLKKEYDDKKQEVLKKVAEQKIDVDFSEDLVEYDNINDIEAYHKKVAGEAFMKVANMSEENKEENKDDAPTQEQTEEKAQEEIIEESTQEQKQNKTQENNEKNNEENIQNEEENKDNT